ncbi:hypothetical protein [Herbaspirillum lusitanum]|uniref:hypothetical protein n=1 Tax=Herbaspirillum lusitanum TaxID=213312 RepID=UPI0002FB783A|nr:hypothetical protein [Herbaspirillum lusitanum]
MEKTIAGSRMEQSLSAASCQNNLYFLKGGIVWREVTHVRPHHFLHRVFSDAARPLVSVRSICAGPFGCYSGDTPPSLRQRLLFNQHSTRDP